MPPAEGTATPDDHSKYSSEAEFDDDDLKVRFAASNTSEPNAKAQPKTRSDNATKNKKTAENETNDQRNLQRQLEVCEKKGSGPLLIFNSCLCSIVGINSGRCTISSKALYAMIACVATPTIPGTDAVETLLTDRFSLHR